MKRRTIGVLVDSAIFKKVPLNSTGYEKIEFYQKAAKMRNMSVLFMSLEKIDFMKNKAIGWMKKKGKYRLMERNIPKIIHNRAMPFAKSPLKKLKLLCQVRSVFNRKTRYDKLKIYTLLHRYADIQHYLPVTQPFSKQGLERMSKQFDQLFIKPRSGSVGKGICKLSHSPAKNRWSFYSMKQRKRITSAEIYPTLKKSVKKRRYLIQEGIRLLKYKGNPFDIRVSVQRNGRGAWNITGMVGKVAKKGGFLTNVARGGKVIRCDDLFRHNGLAVAYTQDRISHASLQIARYLGNRVKGLADLGLDIGIDQKGNIKLIEVNGRDQRYAFKEGKMRNTWFQTYKNPIDYAAYLGESKAPVKE